MRTKNTIKYYLLICLALALTFFTNDFGLTDIQKTALVIAVGVDKEEENFIVTSQIALPKSEKEGENTQSAQIVSKGKTVAEAFEQINAKTGWYPKLVFCQVVVLGESATKTNAFDCLNFFLRDEYLSDGCLLATCDGSAQEILTAKTPVEELSALAMQKVLSSHAERVGTVLPTTLREFSALSFSESRSAYMPLLKAEPPQEINAKNQKEGGQVRDEGNSSEKEGKETQSNEQGQGDQKEQETKGSNENEKVFSASETALFYNGIRVGKLTAKETKTFSFFQNKLRLATYLVQENSLEYALTVKRNSPKMRLTIKDSSAPILKISLTVTAGILDEANLQTIDETTDAGKIPNGVLPKAEETLRADLLALFEKTRALNCDIFKCKETLKRKNYKDYYRLKDEILTAVQAKIEVKFQNVR